MDRLFRLVEQFPDPVPPFLSPTGISMSALFKDGHPICRKAPAAMREQDILNFPCVREVAWRGQDNPEFVILGEDIASRSAISVEGRANPGLQRVPKIVIFTATGAHDLAKMPDILSRENWRQVLAFGH